MMVMGGSRDGDGGGDRDRICRMVRQLHESNKPRLSQSEPTDMSGGGVGKAPMCWPIKFFKFVSRPIIIFYP